MRLALALLLVAAAAGTSRAETLVVEMKGFRSDKGKALVALFASKDGFPDKPKKAVRRVEVEIKQRAAVAVIDRVPPGTYAVAVLHDEDNNKAMKTGLFGIPKEGYGASQDARGNFGPPSFSDARFQIRPGRRVTTRLKLAYH
ncbi:MAG TPA: DUF2141 domain-containing protein [Kofleriaceae bacterium]|nr:DUF2141 domain-containing protein [Kofleriaceae bacterium]